MNELIFFTHISLIVLVTYFALRLGKPYLIAWTALQAVLANLFVIKQTMLFGLNVTCSDAYAVGGFLSLNLAQEYFGKETAKKMLYTSLFILGAFGVFSFVQLQYVPSNADWANNHFVALLKHSPRILGTSFICFFIAQAIDLFTFSKIRKKLPLVVAMIVTLTISQAIDTTLFGVLALSGLVESLWSIIAMSMAIKMICIITMSLSSKGMRMAYEV